VGLNAYFLIVWDFVVDDVQFLVRLFIYGTPKPTLRELTDQTLPRGALRKMDFRVVALARWRGPEDRGGVLPQVQRAHSAAESPTTSANRPDLQPVTADRR
jgi:hypothetical protein